MVRVTARLAEVIAAFVRQHREHEGDRLEAERAALGVLSEELVDAGLQPLPLAIPEASPITVVTNAVLANPTLARSVAEWAELLGMSQSSLNRAFRRDARAALGVWCRRARLLHALRRLASGGEVAAVASELGYGTSAFVHMFRKALGTTPGRYFAAFTTDDASASVTSSLPLLACYVRSTAPMSALPARRQVSRSRRGAAS